MTKHVAAIIVAAGRGSRLSGDTSKTPKQYLSLDDRPVLTHTVNRFLTHPEIAQVLVVRHHDDLEAYEAATSLCTQSERSKLLPAAIGGATRQQSVLNGLMALNSCSPDLVLIHDAARPFVSNETISSVIAELRSGHPAVLAATPVFDTLKRLDPTDNQLQTVDRTHLWAAQTPQGFDYQAIVSAHQAAATQGRTDFTDDTAIAEWDKMPIVLAEGSADNFKITTRTDLTRAKERLRMTSASNALTSSSSQPKLADLGDVRMGTGYDVHAFEDGDAVILGGTSIPHDRKLKGHSDADVVLHAITDALLGAIGDGDIGQHFPPSDPKWKGAASDQFLIDAVRRVSELGGRIAHIDTTIICEAPKIGPHRETIRQSIASICDVPLQRVSVKATTSERLGFTGRKEGIATVAAVTVRLPFTGDEIQ
ncbi:bifunctional 2-C-methyl-D-erythritol 4-phosphate cytidylyltransferase/2-C-methyl-D-erythritol 2,4-cyclodiphosphate synthase [Roseibium sp.]|uniref:bifunctional 2-C-methyl-D-erythritol 4-phosphate cytidylyltransferase/2-C-methyl-D-erythritol 2,4-cyclodiphosphate synthase n=1 Tax=Roseibium sp. TaxID=1936156 RepID=UPI003A97B10C